MLARAFIRRTDGGSGSIFSCAIKQYSTGCPGPDAIVNLVTRFTIVWRPVKHDNIYDHDSVVVLHKIASLTAKPRTARNTPLGKLSDDREARVV